MVNARQPFWWKHGILFCLSFQIDFFYYPLKITKHVLSRHILIGQSFLKTFETIGDKYNSVGEEGRNPCSCAKITAGFGTGWKKSIWCWHWYDVRTIFGRFLRTDNILIVCLSFLFTLENVHTQMKKLFLASSVQKVDEKLWGWKRGFNNVWNNLPLL